jgi:hypothetical protein
MVEKMVSITILIAVEIMIVLGITLSANIGTFGSAYAQANATTNQKGKTTGPTPSEQASQSIRGAITDTGQFVHNATVKVAGSKSAQTLVNESSDVLGNATVATKKYFGSK